MTPSNSPIQQLVLVTGLSGSGMSTALKYFEDLGFYWVDNLPIELLLPVVHHFCKEEGKFPLVAIGFHFRDQAEVAPFLEIHTALEKLARRYELLFLEASRETLITRYRETRRRHPLVMGEREVSAAVELDITTLQPIRALADLIIDTTAMAVPRLKSRLDDLFHAGDFSGVLVFLRSFGFKYGTNSDADMILDARFLPNPHYDPQLRPYSGLDQPVRQFLEREPETTAFLERLQGLFGYLIPKFCSEGKRYLTIDIGCTGGRHRSVYLVERLARELRELGHQIQVRHRDIDRT